LKQLQEQLAQKRATLAKRFDEVAKLTAQLEKDQLEVDELQAKVAALAEQQAAKAVVFRVELTEEQREKNRKHIELIAGSDLFDAEWYLATYPDVAKSEKFAGNPAGHYTLFGAFEGRKPCPEFDSSFYLRTNADVAKAGINPLAHYLNFGREEGRPFAPSMDGE
jgi:hypothetical protein